MDTATAISGLRAAVGVPAWATPNLAGRLFLLDPDDNPQAAYLARLFGVRDVALAAGLAQSSGEDRRRWLQLGMACDVADALAALFGARAGYLSKPTAVFVGGVAVAAAAMGAKALSEPAPSVT